MKEILQIAGLVLMIVLVSSCQKEDQTALKNMEEIYKEQGIPVEVRAVEEEDFSTYLTFTSSLKGIKESTGSSLLADTVEEILVEVGDYVEKDQPIIRFPKDNPSLSYYQAKAGFEAAEKGFQRIESLYESKGVSRQSYDDTKTQYEVQKANWLTVNDMVEVKAPLSGYITRLNVQTSDNVHPGDSLFTVSNYDELTSVVWVTDHEIQQIQTGQRATAEWEGTVLNGIVSQVDLAMDSQKKAFAVHVNFGNVEHSVPSGVTADIDIETELLENAIVLHRSEILKNQNDWYVYVDKDGYASRRIIQPGQRQGMFYQVEAGLQQGDKLITQGVNLVRDQSPIFVVKEASSVLVKKD